MRRAARRGRRRRVARSRAGSAIDRSRAVGAGRTDLSRRRVDHDGNQTARVVESCASFAPRRGGMAQWVQTKVRRRGGWNTEQIDQFRSSTSQKKRDQLGPSAVSGKRPHSARRRSEGLRQRGSAHCQGLGEHNAAPGRRQRWHAYRSATRAPCASRAKASIVYAASRRAADGRERVAARHAKSTHARSAQLRRVLSSESAGVCRRGLRYDADRGLSREGEAPRRRASESLRNAADPMPYHHQPAPRAQPGNALQ